MSKLPNDPAKPLGLAPQEPPAPAPITPEQGEKVLPQGTVCVCPYHHVPCVSNKSMNAVGGGFNYYKCPEKGCSFSQKVPKPQLKQFLHVQQPTEDFSAR